MALELNSGLVERFGRGPAFKERANSRQPVQPVKPANVEIQRYFNSRRVGAGAPRWTTRPEVPFPEELLPYPILPTQDFVPNTISSGDWSSSEPAGWGPDEGNHDAASDENNSLATEDASTNNRIKNNFQESNGNADVWATESNVTRAWSTQSEKGDNWEQGPDGEGWTTQEPGDGWADDAWVDQKLAAETNEWENQNNDSVWDQPHKIQTSDADDDEKNNSESASAKTEREAVSERVDATIEPAEQASSSKQGEEDPHTSPADGWQSGEAEANAENYTDWGNANDPEMKTTEEDDDAYESFANVGNIVDGPWPSKIDYLRSHYLLLREDALRPLREAVEHVRSMPDLDEDPSRATIGIYDQVQVCGITFARRGLGIRVKFSLARVGKNIHWAQSKRLITGTLVLLMSPDKSKCKVATVAARPLENLNKNPPEIDLFFGRAEDFDIDCTQDWIMIEERGSFFEAQRHTLVALQRMVEERFPLQEHLISLQTNIPPPAYVESNPVRDLRPISSREQNTQLLRDVDILQEWPEDIHPNLDESQMSALNTILTKRLSVVQGPPGTGKTYVSVQALKVMLANMQSGDPPIVITCQTNHALDQLLGHVATFEEKFVRIGGRSKDEDVIKKRTLYELKQERKPPPFKWQAKWRKLEADMEKLLAPLMKGPAGADSRDTIDLELLRELGVLSNEQCDSVINGAKEWVSHEQDADDKPLLKWIGKQLEPVKQRHQPMLVGYEEIDEGNIGFEEVMEQEAEQVTKDEDEDLDRLGGQFWSIGDTWTGRAIDNKAARDQAKELLNTKKDLWKIRTSDRGNVYRHIQREAKIKITERLRHLFPQYELACQDRKIHRYEFDETILKENKVVGLTTTGVSKYRGLVAALKPKIVLIEEAAETLEGPVIAACLESVEHLILVGDHKQLRPNCHVMALQKPPYNLNISLFERLVNNNVDYRILQKQRRMKPEIRRMLKPIYGKKINDHRSVQKIENRPLVPGMGGLTTWFFTHEAPEERDQDFSSFNQFEAQMILGLVQYLHYNGVDARHITILTFYNGQRRLIRSLFAQDEKARGKDLRDVQLVTVDSYQGEENEVVILSLVRSNTEGKIGFIGVDNRVCVALSRARRGFYIFGNAQLLCGESWLWSQVVTLLANDYVGTPTKNEEHATGSDLNPGLSACRIGYTLPLWCKRHKRRFWICDPHDWTRNVGGCDRLCGGLLTCGHRCPELCHPWSHDLYSCKETCFKMLSCGHRCQRECFQMPCECGKGCKTTISDLEMRPSAQSLSTSPTKGSSTAERYQKFAEDGSVDETGAMQAHLARSEQAERIRQEQVAAARQLIDEENQRLLFEDDVKQDDVETKLVKSVTTEDGSVRRTWETTYQSPPVRRVEWAKGSIQRPQSLMDA